MKLEESIKTISKQSMRSIYMIVDFLIAVIIDELILSISVAYFFRVKHAI